MVVGTQSLNSDRMDPTETLLPTSKAEQWESHIQPGEMKSLKFVRHSGFSVSYISALAKKALYSDLTKFKIHYKNCFEVK